MKTVSLTGRILAGAMLVVLPASGTVRGALLEGKTLVVNLTHLESLSSLQTGIFNTATVGPGIELPNLGGITDPPTIPLLVNIDLSDRQILITLLNDQLPALVETFSFIDALGTVPGFFTNKVTTNAATNWAGFHDGRVLDDSEQIQVLLGGLQGLEGQFILLDVVPEPAAAGLFALGAGAVAARRRRRMGAVSR